MRESAAATPGDAVATSGERTGRWREGFRSFRTGLSVPLAIVIASRLFSVAVLFLVTYATGHAYPITEMDSGWYIGIATSGYHTGIVKGGHDLAFFPGWPLLIKFGTLGFLDPSFVAVFLANLISMIALVLVWFVLRQRLGERTASGRRYRTDVRPGVQGVGDDKADHCRIEGPVVVLAQHARQTFAGHQTDLGAHVLDGRLHRQHRDGRPERGKAVLGASLGVSPDARRIVVRCPGDEAGTESLAEALQWVLLGP